MLGKYQDAAKHFSNAVRLQSDSVEAHFGFVIAVNRYSTTSEAAPNHLDRILREDPDHFPTLTHFAILSLLRYDDLKAVRLVTKALKVNPSFVPALVCLAELLRLSGRPERAVDYYTKALALISN